MAFISPFETRSGASRQPQSIIADNTRPSPAHKSIQKHSYSFPTTKRVAAVDALGARDLVDGSLLAFALAFIFSYLQERRREQPSAAASLKEPLQMRNTTVSSEQKQNNVFDSWKEMSREENYIYYNNRVKRRQSATPPTAKREQKWVVVALLVLFVPIFSAEFFLALSRQVLCGGNPLTQSSWAAELCSPRL